MSLAPPQLPSPAATPDQSSSQHPSPNATEEEIRDQVEKRLLLLSQDLYELEICAGEVVAGQEDRVPNFL
jgi:mediator of RNA polymerase II transcription subunit 10